MFISSFGKPISYKLNHKKKDNMFISSFEKPISYKLNHNRSYTKYILNLICRKKILRSQKGHMKNNRNKAKLSYQKTYNYPFWQT